MLIRQFFGGFGARFVMRGWDRRFRNPGSGFRGGLLSPFAGRRGSLVFNRWRRLVGSFERGGSGAISPGSALRGDTAAHFQRNVVVD